MTSRDPYYHLTLLQSAKLRIRIHTHLLDNGGSLTRWMKDNKITCDIRKITHPSEWRISYGMLRRISKALGVSTDRLYRDLEG